MDQAGVLREMRGFEKEKGFISLPSDRLEKRDSVRVIAVTSGKGGVGKTNLAANIAYALSQMGKKTLVMDADAGLANIDVILGLTPQYNLYHILNGEKTLSEVIVQGPGGIQILPAASGISEMTELSSGQKLTLLDDLNCLNDGLDYIFIDTAAGITGNVMYFNMMAKENIIVVSPEPTSLTDAYALIKVLYKNYSAKRFMLLVNMVSDANEAMRVFRRLSNATEHFLNLSIEYLGHVVHDKRVTEAVRQQSILMEGFPTSKASRCIVTIAKKLSQEGPGEYDSGTIKLFGRRSVIKSDNR